MLSRFLVENQLPPPNSTNTRLPSLRELKLIPDDKFEKMSDIQKKCVDFAEYMDGMRSLSFKLPPQEVMKLYAYFFHAYFGPYQEADADMVSLCDLMYKLKCAPIPAATLDYWRQMAFITRTEALRLWMTTVTIWGREIDPRPKLKLLEGPNNNDAKAGDTQSEKDKNNDREVRNVRGRRRQRKNQNRHRHKDQHKDQENGNSSANVLVQVQVQSQEQPQEQSQHQGHGRTGRAAHLKERNKAHEVDQVQQPTTAVAADAMALVWMPSEGPASEYSSVSSSAAGGQEHGVPGLRSPFRRRSGRKNNRNARATPELTSETELPRRHETNEDVVVTAVRVRPSQRRIIHPRTRTMRSTALR